VLGRRTLHTLNVKLSVSSLLPKSLKNSLQNLPKLALRLRLIRGITPLIRNRNWIDILPSANLHANVYHNQSAKSFRATRAYGRSKLCNILFTRELARSLRGTGVTANCLHPGFVATRFADESGGLISRFARLAKFFAISPAEGAQTIIYLASSPEVANVSGKYFYKCRPTTPSASALDDRAALALWARRCGFGRLKGITDALESGSSGAKESGRLFVDR
jgi:Enoyl-(Acyl carrier protein) reductase